MKKEYILMGAAALIGAYVLMPKGEDAGPGGSGGLGAGLGGLPGVPGTGGGGSDTPTVNIDFPNMGPVVFPDQGLVPDGKTKKEEASTGLATPYNVLGDYTRDDSWKNYVGAPPSSDYSTYTAPSWKDPSNPNMTGSDILNMVKNRETKKEDAITSVWDLRLFGKSREQQMAIAPSLFQKTAPRTETFSSSSKLSVNKSPTPEFNSPYLTKKETRTSSSSGSGSSTYYKTRSTPAPKASAGGPMISFINNQGRFF